VGRWARGNGREDLRNLARGAQEIQVFIEKLARLPVGASSCNFFDHSNPENAVRRRNLELYLQDMLERRPKVLLVGEAPGYRGMRLTGVPFTNRDILQSREGYFGLFGPDRGYVLPAEAAPVAAEPTATVMWDVLAGLDFLPLLWSAYPLHSHQPGRPLSNRTPSAAEALAGRPFWQELAKLFAVKSVVAVGNVGFRSVSASGLSVPKVRHPAHGGKVKFRDGLKELLAAGMDG
jgi:uracil-DNA glycosylase